jgi:hypothetical protein
VSLFRPNKTEGSSALKDAAVTALSKVETEEYDSVSALKVMPELPDWEVARISLMYYSDTYPTQRELTEVSDYLEAAYDLRVQSATIDLSKGNSWTDPNAVWIVHFSLQGKPTK